MPQHIAQASPEPPDPQDDPSGTVTVLQAASRLGIGRALGYEAVRTGQIPSIRIGKRILVPKAALARLMTE
jgi:excisionase family DNA binding protein